MSERVGGDGLYVGSHLSHDAVCVCVCAGPDGSSVLVRH
jgi:hypothetical protein